MRRAEALAERKFRPINTGKMPVPLLTGTGFAGAPPVFRYSKIPSCMA